MSKFSVAMKKFGGFMKRNAFYFLILLCIASVATVIALAVTYNSAQNIDSSISDQPDVPTIKPDDPNTDNPDDPVDPKPPVKKLTFLSPCNDGEVTANYSDTQLVWNQSLKQYETHMALDFTSADLNVFASAEGTVKEIGHNDLDGNYIVLAHEDGYITKYMSLETASTLKVGAKVEQGQLLGKMSTTQGSESMDGAHLHFEVWKDNAQINPLEVLVLGDK